MKHQSKVFFKPPSLKYGDTIGIVAPSSPFDVRIFKKGVSALKSKGFKVLIMPEIFDKKGYLAGSDHKRAEVINRLFTDKRVKALFCARGGYGAIRIIELLDYDSILKNPKIFLGFSDATALLVCLDKLKIASFHGPVVTSIVNSDSKTLDAVFFAICSEKPVHIEIKDGVTIKKGSGSGPVLAGNLTTFCHLLGTKYQPDFKERILIIEDANESPYKIDRMLLHLKLAGCFENLAAIGIGSFENCGCKKEIYNIVSEVLEDFNFPVIAGLPTGHGHSNITLPLGVMATLDADDKILAYHEPGTRCANP